MIDSARLSTFLAVAVILVVAPGPDFAMTTRNVLRGGRRAGILTGLGVAGGSIVWTVASIVGILALLRVSSIGFDLVRLVGSVYLIWLGGRSLWSAATGGEPTTKAQATKSIEDGQVDGTTEDAGIPPATWWPFGRD